MERGLDDDENNDYNGEDCGVDDDEIEGGWLRFVSVGGDVSAPADVSAPVVLLVYICFIRTVCKK